MSKSKLFNSRDTDVSLNGVRGWQWWRGNARPSRHLLGGLLIPVSPGPHLDVLIAFVILQATRAQLAADTYEPEYW
jgi:hypothetical protein